MAESLNGTSTPAGTVTHMDTATFDEEIAGSAEPILVDFWAEWCGPCKKIAPILDEIAAEYAGRIRVGKLNVDDHETIARRFDILSIPTLILFKDGKPELRIRGLKGKQQLVEELQAFL